MKEIHITLLGKECLPLYYPIIEFKSDEVFVIGTMQNEAIARRLKDVLEGKSIPCKIFCDVNAFDIKSIITKCEEIQQTIGENNNVTYNITGGTKLMALGAFIVAKKYNAKIIYTDSVTCINLNTYTSTPLNSNVDTKTIFKLQGQSLKDYKVYAYDGLTHNVANKIRFFIQNNKKIFKGLHRLYTVDELPSHFDNGKYKYQSTSGHICIKDDYGVMLEIEHPNVEQMLFEGRWWETLVADSICKWAGGKYEIWQNVTFYPRDIISKMEDNDKNEIDILVNTGNKLLFVECKSGFISQDNINKMSVIRQNYGSDKSRSVLVSYYKINSDLREKADETKLNVIDGRHALDNISREFNNILQSIKA